MSITNAKKTRKKGLKKVFRSLKLQTYQTYIQHAFKVFEWLSMMFLELFLKTETLVVENYCPSATVKRNQPDKGQHPGPSSAADQRQREHNPQRNKSSPTVFLWLLSVALIPSTAFCP